MVQVSADKQFKQGSVWSDTFQENTRDLVEMMNEQYSQFDYGLQQIAITGDIENGAWKGEYNRKENMTSGIASIGLHPDKADLSVLAHELGHDLFYHALDDQNQYSTLTTTSLNETVAYLNQLDLTNTLPTGNLVPAGQKSTWDTIEQYRETKNAIKQQSTRLPTANTSYMPRIENLYDIYHELTQANATITAQYTRPDNPMDAREQRRGTTNELISNTIFEDIEQALYQTIAIGSHLKTDTISSIETDRFSAAIETLYEDNDKQLFPAITEALYDGLRRSFQGNPPKEPDNPATAVQFKFSPPSIYHFARQEYKGIMKDAFKRSARHLTELTEQLTEMNNIDLAEHLKEQYSDNRYGYRFDQRYDFTHNIGRKTARKLSRNNINPGTVLEEPEKHISMIKSIYDSIILQGVKRTDPNTAKDPFITKQHPEPGTQLQLEI